MRQVRADRRRRRETRTYLAGHPGWPPAAGAPPAWAPQPAPYAGAPQPAPYGGSPQPAPYVGAPYVAVPAARISRVWAWAPLLSFGLLTFLPFLRIATARNSRRDWVTFASYLGVSVALLAIEGAGGTKGAVGAALSAVGLVLIAVATAHALIEFRSLQPTAPVFTAPPRAAPIMPDPVAAARARIGRRERARELARKDPVLARELRIGRPDLPRQYDDGGLVDVNNVPAGVLAQHLQLTAQEAQAVLDARGQLGRFTSAEELSVYAQLAPASVDVIKDLLWFG